MAEGEVIRTLGVAVRAVGRASLQLLVVLAVIAALRREFLGAAPPGYPPVAVIALVTAWVTLSATALRGALRTV